jgi:hypothetical protein
MDIAVGSVADRCLLSGVIQTSHFKGVRTIFDPIRTLTLAALSPEAGFTSGLAAIAGRDTSGGAARVVANGDRCSCAGIAVMA